MEGLPRRSSGDSSSLGVTGLPSGSSGEGSLGLRLNSGPAQPSRHADVFMTSTTAVESALFSMPTDEGNESLYGAANEGSRNSSTPATESLEEISFSHPPHRRSVSPPGPSAFGRRVSAQGHHRKGQTGSLQMNLSTSTSALQLKQDPPHSLVSPLLRPSASMIRKKSGELVKPSLKARSMSTPDLFRQDDGSEPVTPEAERDRAFPEERSKSVRFAGADEDDTNALESVVLFLREQQPAAVGKAIGPDFAAGHITETETEVETDASDFVQFRTRRNAAARAADEAEDIVLQEGSMVPRMRVDFAPDKKGSLSKEHVILEKAELISGTVPLSLQGSVIVRNVAFQKYAAIRFTLDHWQ